MDDSGCWFPTVWVMKIGFDTSTCSWSQFGPAEAGFPLPSAKTPGFSMAWHAACVQGQDNRFGHRTVDFCLLSEKVKTSGVFWHSHVSFQWNILQFCRSLFLPILWRTKIWCVSLTRYLSELLKGAWFLDPLTLNIFDCRLSYFFFGLQTVEFTQGHLNKLDDIQKICWVHWHCTRLKQGCNNRPIFNIWPMALQNTQVYHGYQAMAISNLREKQSSYKMGRSAGTFTHLSHFAFERPRHVGVS